jgi:uncharacterized protein (DUF2345 family)
MSAQGFTAATSSSSRTELELGYALESKQGEGRGVLTLYAADGQACLEIVLTPKGPVVHLRTSALKISADEDIEMGCERLTVHAKKDIRIHAGGHLVQSADGDVGVRAGGLLATEGHAQDIRARMGDVRIAANDDVEVDGERIRLNSPKEGSVTTKADPRIIP